MSPTAPNHPFVPRMMFFTKGVGRHKERLASFEMSLRDAGVAPFNLVRVSSIYPPNCRIVTRAEGLKHLRHGQIVFVVESRQDTDEAGRLIASAVGLALPADETHYGYLSEHHTYGQDAREAGIYSEDLAASMLASTLGIEFDPHKNYYERKEIYKMSGKIVKAQSIAAAAKGTNALWTTTYAASVLIL